MLPMRLTERKADELPILPDRAEELLAQLRAKAKCSSTWIEGNEVWGYPPLDSSSTAAVRIAVLPEEWLEWLRGLR